MLSDKTKKLVELHGWSISEVEHATTIFTTTFYQEFEQGFVLLLDTGTTNLLIAASENDMHSMDMWRVIRTLLQNRDKPIITQYERNTEKLFKASKRYGVLRLENNIAYFP